MTSHRSMSWTRSATASANESEGSLLRRHGPQISDDRVQVGRRHSGIIAITHRRLQLGAVLAEALRDRALDVLVGPGANTFLLVRRDVARHRHAPRSFQLEPALAEIIVEVPPF